MWGGLCVSSLSFHQLALAVDEPRIEGGVREGCGWTKAGGCFGSMERCWQRWWWSVRVMVDGRTAVRQLVDIVLWLVRVWQCTAVPVSMIRRDAGLQPGRQAVSQPASQPASQPVSQSSISESVTRSIVQQIVWLVIPSFGPQPAIQPTIQPNHPSSQPLSQSSSRSFSQSSSPSAVWIREKAHDRQPRSLPNLNSNLPN